MKFSFILLSVLFVFLGCSLKYDENVDAEATNPEFIFYDTKVTRYEDKIKTVEFSAENIERYKNSDAIYGKKIAFTTYDKAKASSNPEMEGNCGLLYADTAHEIYELYDGIKMFSSKQNISFSADILRWNAKTEQLTSGRTDMVRLEKDGTVITGSGFSATGVSGKFNFTGSVSGNIETKNRDDEKKAEGEKAE